MGIFSDHAYTSITIKIDQLAKPHQNDEIDSAIELYISDLLHLIKIQMATGPAEAARAIRKRIKYGDSAEEQLRALQILELLVLNAGAKIGPVIARDDKLIDVLKGIITGHGHNGAGGAYPREVQLRVKALAVGWKSELKDIDGYEYLASLWKSLPHKKTRSRSEFPRSHADDDVEDPSNVFESSDAVRDPSPSSPAMQRATGKIRKSKRPSRPQPEHSSHQRRNGDRNNSKKRFKKKKGIVYADEEFGIPQINYKVEAPRIRLVIADCHTHTTALNNQLIALPSHLSPLDDEAITKEFEACKSIRRKVLKYLQFVGVGDESTKAPEVAAMDLEFLGSLISANEQLVQVFKKFDLLAGYTDENPAPDYDEESSGESYYTDSDYDEAESTNTDTLDGRLNDLSIKEGSSSASATRSPPPPRPAKPARLTAPHKLLQRMDTSSTISSDPFGDTNEVSRNKSLYE